ncbi:hypothetical protein HK096_006880 [Nowakowskiella sp. JEL0078]|nr:hypothetical protein HK096_006880 [Nowakowskiella sp. JEL0078]
MSSSDNFFKALGIVTGMLLAFALAAVTPRSLIRYLLGKFLPPGTGPTEEQLKKSHAEMNYLGTTHGEGEDRKQAMATIKIRGDPGYLEGSKMLAECALCIIYDENKLKDARKEDTAFPLFNGGILTPATAFGSVLVDRLNASGISFEIKEIIKS